MECSIESLLEKRKPVLKQKHGFEHEHEQIKKRFFEFADCCNSDVRIKVIGFQSIFSRLLYFFSNETLIGRNRTSSTKKALV